MAKDFYESNINELLQSIDSSAKGDTGLSFLVLVYSTLDILAWLSRDQHEAEATKNDFLNWVNEFLLPGSKLDCSAEDLYFARCAVIHSYAPDWGVGINRSEKETNKIIYAWDKVGARYQGETVNTNFAKRKTIVLQPGELISALKIAIQRFDDSLSFNRSLSELVFERAEKYFGDLSK